MQHLSYNIKIIRSLWGINQTRFAEVMKVSVPMQKSYESGKANPDDLYIQRLSGFTGVSEEDIKRKKLKEKDIGIKVEFEENGENGAGVNKDHGGQNDHRETIDILKKHNDLLAKIVEANLTVIQSNLTALATTQHIILSQVQAGLKRDAHKDSDGDEKKMKEILAQVSTFAGEYLESYGVKGSPAAVGT